MATATTKNYYQILGVAESASQDEIKSAYRSLAKKYHPDVYKGDVSFTEINEAYEILSDSYKKYEYDSLRKGQIRIPFGRQNMPRKGNDLFGRIEITLEEAVSQQAVIKQIAFDRKDPCDKCNQTGCKDGRFVTANCSGCGGNGFIANSNTSGTGWQVFARMCPVCYGKGQIIPQENKCDCCNGDGILNKTIRLDVNIPRGIRNGGMIRCHHEGEKGHNGGPSGDLFINVFISNHPVFKLVETDLYMVARIPVEDAVLGGKKSITTLYNNVISIDIPAGSQSMDRIAVEGYGYPKAPGNMKGNLYINLLVEIPKSLTEDQRRLYETLRGLGENNGNGKESSIKEESGAGEQAGVCQGTEVCNEQ